MTINDKPRFNHRGTMIDTSRHFQSLQTILDHLVRNILYTAVVHKLSWENAVVNLGIVLFCTLLPLLSLRKKGFTIRILIFFTGCYGIQQVQRITLAHRRRSVVSVREHYLSRLISKGIDLSINTSK